MAAISDPVPRVRVIDVFRLLGIEIVPARTPLWHHPEKIAGCAEQAPAV
jgi:hypothetical protein